MSDWKVKIFGLLGLLLAAIAFISIGEHFHAFFIEAAISQTKFRKGIGLSLVALAIGVSIFYGCLVPIKGFSASAIYECSYKGSESND